MPAGWKGVAVQVEGETAVEAMVAVAMAAAATVEVVKVEAAMVALAMAAAATVAVVAEAIDKVGSTRATSGRENGCQRTCQQPKHPLKHPPKHPPKHPRMVRLLEICESSGHASGHADYCTSERL